MCIFKSEVHTRTGVMFVLNMQGFLIGEILYGIINWGSRHLGTQLSLLC